MSSWFKKHFDVEPLYVPKEEGAQTNTAPKKEEVKLTADQKKKMDQINDLVKEIFVKVHHANKLFDDQTPRTFYENQAKAREIYLA